MSMGVRTDVMSTVFRMRFSQITRRIPAKAALSLLSWVTGCGVRWFSEAV
jgi:hypothetical protein